MFRRSVIITSLLLLSACSTTVVEEADRDLPAIPEPQAEESANTSAIEQEREDTQSEFTVNTSESLIAFIGAKGNLTSHEGLFKQFNGTWSNANNIENSSLALTINIDSMLTDSEGLTDHLKADDFFDVANFPEATFVSSSITPYDDGRKVTINGLLTIKGVSEEVSMDGMLNSQFLSANYNLDRTTFGVGGPADGLKGIDANVPVEIKLIWE